MGFINGFIVIFYGNEESEVVVQIGNSKTPKSVLYFLYPKNKNLN